VKRLVFPLLLGTLILAGCGDELPTTSGAADGYERVVLSELFTAVWCGNCPLAEEALDRLHDEEGPERLAVIHWHPSFGAGDPLSIPLADERVEDYRAILGDQPGLPVNVFNGAQGISQGNLQTYARYRARYESEAALLSDYRISITPDVRPSEFEVDVDVMAYPGTEARTLDLLLVLLEHPATNPGESGPEELSYTARAGKRREITVSGTGMVSETLLFDVAADGLEGFDLARGHLVAFVQEREPSGDRDFREVLQAEMIPLVAAGEDFYAFRLDSDATERGLPLAATVELPVRIANTGTLDDTLTVDLPSELQDYGDWDVAFRSDLLGDPEPPFDVGLDAATSLFGLRLAVTAGDAGAAQLAVVVSSHGDPSLSDTLRFSLEAGTLDVDLAAAATNQGLVVGEATELSFTLTNAGTIRDSVLIAVDDGLTSIPTDWSVVLTDQNDATYIQPHALGLAAGETRSGWHLAVTASSEGAGDLGLVVTSLFDSTAADTVVYALRARAYDVTLSSTETNPRVVVDQSATVAFTVANRGARDDLVRLTMPAALQNVPAGWELALAYDGLELETPYLLALGSGQSATGFALEVNAARIGLGRAQLVATSAGDPTAADTLAFTITANSYGYTVVLEDGFDVSLEPDVETSKTLTLTNTGSLDDTLLLTMPAALQSLPAGWTVTLTNPAGEPLLLPWYVNLEAGEADATVRLYALAPTAGSGSVSLVVTSAGAPALTDTIAITLTAQSSDYGVALAAPELTVQVEPGEYGEGHFEVTNTGAVPDQIMLRAEALVTPPAWTQPPVICEPGICWAPVYTIPYALQPGQTVNIYYVDLFVPAEGGTGTVRLTASSISDPSTTDAIVFTFTTEGLLPLGAVPGSGATSQHELER